MKTNQKNNLDFIIVGCGVSGIASAIELILKKKNFIIIEKRDTFGGCWNDALSTSELQTDRNYYKFFDVNYDLNTPIFPDKLQMLNYFKKTILFYKLFNYIKFNENATIKYNQNQNKWMVQTQNNLYFSNHILYCGGLNSKPKYPDLKITTGIISNTLICHSKYINTYLNDYTKFKNLKKIVIIGNGASGCDILKFIDKNKYKNNYEITMLYKSNKYYLKKKIFNVPGSLILSENFLKFFELVPLCINYFLMYISNIFIFKNYLDLPVDKINCKNIVGSDIINTLLLKNNNQFMYLKENITYIDAYKKIIKTNNSILSDIDLIIFATGYNTIYPFIFSYLYKYIIPVDMNYKIVYPNIAFIGYNSTYNFIDNCRFRVLWYLKHIYKQKNDTYRISGDIDVDEISVFNWISKTQKRKNMNKLSFLDSTYELFEIKKNKI